ncbi:short-chain type dehydrogenase, putative [Paecilomyces variotii No. 5]|uniref:Short-chain type dehydrogenase, putative n=1 Tax=Byssochlamys spectabilis (strain No. 5 / NBRC 109023) TaxID=1356009 RepID=V5FVJ8_BYSSN|nr:short-chain type dehydrogenase, putative [Paecilomyces variotii No. 5]
MTSSSTSIPLTLSGKTAIITGASRGIGEGIALDLASRGAKVVLTYSSPKSDSAVSTTINKIKSLNNGSDAISIRTDLRHPSALGEIVSATLSAFGPHIDILVNNAGCELAKPITDMTVEDFSYVYDLNVRAPLLLCGAVVPHLRAPGRIINISSVGARCGFKNFSAYCSSKAALEGLTRVLAAELGEKGGHTVNAVNPGPVQTVLLEGIPQSLVEWQKDATPVEHRLGTIDDVVQIVAFLAEERSRWVSGQCISASGGFSMW